MDKLPQLKKNIKNFILGEDAKVIDKTATKIALTISYITFSILDANASGGGGEYRHTNQLGYPGNDPLMNNQLDTNYVTTKADPGGSGKVLNIDIPPKTVQSSHGNHYNYYAGSGSS